MKKSYHSYLFKGIIAVLLLSIHFFLNSTIAFGQDGTVSGTVTVAETGETLPGVNVVVGGTTIGTSTDSEGNFELVVPSLQDTLVFSFVGFQTKEIPINGRSTLDVELERQAIAGEEMVVVGYGSQEKESVVGAISVTSSEDLERTGAIGDVGQSLTGQLPGVTTLQTTGRPGEESVQFYIRGQSSWNGGEPLVLVDGVQRSLANLDRSEIESVSVLKDASATAVYGVEGANGVILITTKQGSSRPGGPQVKFKASMSGKQFSSIPNVQTSQPAINLMNDVIEYEGVADGTAWNWYTPQEIVNRYGSEEYKNIYPDVDWRDRMINNVALSKNLTLNISGGTDFTQYFGMLSYQRDGDMFATRDDLDNGYDPSFTYDRINYRSNLNFDLSETTDLDVKVGGYLGTQKSPNKSDIQSSRQIYRVVVTSDHSSVVPRYEDGVLGYNPTLHTAINYDKELNTNGVRRNRSASVNTDVELRQDLNMLVDGLEITGRVSYDITTQNNGPNINDGAWQQKYIDPNIVSAETAADSAAYITYLYNRTDAGFEYQRPYATYGSEGFGIGGLNEQLYYEAALRYKVDIQSHSINTLALFNRRENKNSNNWRSYRENWVGRVTYNYDQRYFLELNGAYSGSEKFGPGYKFDFFPSAAVGYDIASESFFPFEFISQFKVRYSHGIVGNDSGIARWQHIGSFNTSNTTTKFGTNISTSPYTQYSYEKIPNPDAHWASALKQNVGLDAELWQGKVSLGVDRFWEHRTDMFVSGSNRSFPDLFGAQSNPAANLGETKSSGYEVQLEVNQPINEKIALWSKFNFTHAKEKIIARDDPELLPFYQKQQGYQINQNRSLYPVGIMNSWDEVYAGTPETLNNNRLPGVKQIVDFNSDGIINNDDVIPWGYPSRPQNTWNSTVGVNMGGWSFSAQFYGVFNIHRPTVLTPFQAGPGGYKPLVFDYMLKGSNDQWWPDAQNVNGRFASGKLGTETGSSQVGYHEKDGTYIKLKNANISYSFSGEQLGSWTNDVISELRIYASGYNLFFWSRGLPLDVETGSSNWVIAYPIQRRINFGIDIAF